MASDNFTGGKVAVHHLAQLDCQRLLYLSIGSILPSEVFKRKDGTFDFDSIFCGTDHLACFIMGYLKELGLSVPDNVQIIGFDGIKDFVTGRYLCSTIIQPLEQIAKMSVNLILTEDQSIVPSLVCLPVRYASSGTTKEEDGFGLHFFTKRHLAKSEVFNLKNQAKTPLFAADMRFREYL